MSKNPTSLLLVMVQALSLTVIFLSGPVIPGNPFAFILLILSALPGFWALWTMRKSRFQITAEVNTAAKLIKNGPYHYIRHPMYSSLLVFTLILVINHFTFIRLLSWLILFFDLFIKLHYEESLLEKHFHQYKEYEKQTKKLIPGVY